MLEKEILERLDALQGMMMGRAAETQVVVETQPQEGGEVPQEVQSLLFAD